MWIAGTVLLLIVGAGILLFNRIVRARNLVDEAWSGIDVQLKRRHDLVPNLVETVKEYGGHERTLFDDITRLRSETLSVTAPGETGAAENALTRQLKTLFAVAEAYPELKASENFLDLQKSLSDIEDKIQYARRYYNGTVRDYNILIESFPNNLLANPLGFQREEFFEIEYATERKAAEVDFASQT